MISLLFCYLDLQIEWARINHFINMNQILNEISFQIIHHE